MNCHRCKYYYVTWDRAAPHGCRAMGFKGRELPNTVVRSSTGGRDCLMFSAKSIDRRQHREITDTVELHASTEGCDPEAT